MNEALSIPGPCGVLDAELSRCTSENAGLAVLCHPHPLYGGSRHDAVLACAAGVLEALDFDVLRFDFRGVGRSAGSIQGDGSEVDDLLAVVDWARQELKPPTLWVGGYSFGAAIAWRACRSVSVDRLLLIAPPVGRMDFEQYEPGIPVHAFVGGLDDFVDPSALAQLPGVRVVTLPGADHFFSGEMETLAAALEQALMESAD